MRIAYIVTAAIMLMNVQSRAQAPGQQESKPESRSAAKKDLTPEQIIEQFAQKESEFYEAWMQYMYTQTAVVKVLSEDGVRKNETLRIVSEVVFKDDGTREVNILRRSGGLRSVTFTSQDEEVLENVHPFALTAKEIPLYNLKYQGKEKIDELDCHVFSVKPKKINKGKMYFEGKIYVDDQDLQIVKTVGKAVPQTAQNQFPEFETIRQMVDGKYWFPVWTHADSRLYFPNSTVHIEEIITYDDYKMFSTKTRILSSEPKTAEPE
jgi:hypothetical protein